MYNEFDKYLSGNFHDDYWYDEGVTIAQELLESFSEEDWEFLVNEFEDKTLGWRKRLAYCMDDKHNLHQLTILLTLLQDNDDELLELTIDSLRTFDTRQNKELIKTSPVLRDTLVKLMNTPSIPTKRMINDFIKKMNIEL